MLRTGAALAVLAVAAVGVALLVAGPDPDTAYYESAGIPEVPVLPEGSGFFDVLRVTNSYIWLGAAVALAAAAIGTALLWLARRTRPPAARRLAAAFAVAAVACFGVCAAVNSRADIRVVTAEREGWTSYAPLPRDERTMLRGWSREDPHSWFGAGVALLAAAPIALALGPRRRSTAD